MLARKQRHFVFLMLTVLFILFSTIVFSNNSSYTLKTNGKIHGAFEKSPYARILVHLDLKGAPLRVSYYEHLFPLLKQLNVDGILIEYEDTFPYHNSLSDLPRKSPYSQKDIQKILKLAALNNLEIVPLIQTFGHLEFVLKHDKYKKLRENPNEDDSICPSDNQSISLIREMIHQIRTLHPQVKRIHIGADEAYHIAEDERCLMRLRTLGVNQRGIEKLKLRHIANVAKLAHEANFTEVYAWNDMFDKSAVADMKAENLGKLIIPVVWGYAENVLQENYFPQGLFKRLVEVFPEMWFASAYKGANGAKQTYINIDRYLTNQKSYVRLYEHFAQTITGHVGGIVITGWQRYKHHFPLCELFPVALPSLTSLLMYLSDVHTNQTMLEMHVQDVLGCVGTFDKDILAPKKYNGSVYFPMKETVYSHCNFYGADVSKLVMDNLRYLTWERRLINSDDIDVYNGRVKELKSNITDVFRKYFFDDDIEEFLKQNVDTLMILR